MDSRTLLIAYLSFLKRAATNVLIVGLLLTFTIDATPSIPALGPKLQELKSAIDAPIHRLGIWQGSWTLFAPQVRKINLRVKAIVTFADGKVVTIESPDWPKMSNFQRFWHYRDGKFVDAIRADSRQGYWPSYARHFAFNTPHPEGKKEPVTHVTLVRSWSDIPFPSKDNLRLPLNTWAISPTSFSYAFYEAGPFQ